MQSTFEIFVTLLLYAISILAVLALIIRAYYMYISLWGFSKKDQVYDQYEDYLKFIILVPAHNEGSVMKTTIENHTSIEYDNELFEIHYLADNCTDNTADIAREAVAVGGRTNFNIHVRDEENPDKKGKPHALHWLMNKLNDTTGFYGKFDMLVILDADNHVDSNILSEINSQYLSAEHKPLAIQTYLDSKNGNNYIAKGYKYSYRVQNRFYQLAKHRKGINAAIGGTGFAVDVNYLEGIGGFTLKSLTEDLELQTTITLNGGTILWNHNVRIYDEKPTKTYQSFVQKSRWAQGHWWVAFTYGGKMFTSIFTSKDKTTRKNRIDNLVYLFSMTTTLQFMVFLLYTLVSIVLFFTDNAKFEIGLYTLIYRVAVFVFLTGYFLLQVSYSIRADGKLDDEKRMSILRTVGSSFCVWFGGLVYMFSQVKGLMFWRNQKVWKKTEHMIQEVQDFED